MLFVFMLKIIFFYFLRVFFSFVSPTFICITFSLEALYIQHTHKKQTSSRRKRMESNLSSNFFFLFLFHSFYNTIHSLLLLSAFISFHFSFGIRALVFCRQFCHVHEIKFMRSQKESRKIERNDER